MAKKDDFDIDFDDFNFDDFGDNGEGGFASEPPPKSRSPVVSLAGSVLTGVRTSLTDPTNQARLIREALPGGYRQAFDVADTTLSTARSLYDSAAREAKPVIKESKKAARALLPILESVLPKRASEKLKEWSAEEQGRSQIDPEEAEITSVIASVFGTQMDEQRKLYEDSEVRAQVRDLARAKQGEASNQLLQSIESGISRLVSYQDQVAVNLQRKQLEMQYRQYFVSRKSLDIQQQHFELAKASYESIVKNTALPEVVKIHNSELATQLFKEKMFGIVTDPQSTWFRGIRGRIVTKTREKVKEFFSELGSTVSDVAMMGEMVQDQLEQQREFGGGSGGDMARDMAGGMAGSGLVNWLGGKIGKKIRKHLETNSAASSTSLALLRLFQDMPGTVNDWAKSTTTRTGFLGAIEDFFKDAVGTNVRSDKVVSSSVDSLTQNAYWSLMNSKTLNEVIPGWLSRIERNTRKGKDKDLYKFNFDTNDFESTEMMKKRIGRKVYKETDIKAINENALKVLNTIDPDPHQLKPDARKALLNYIIKKAHDREKFDPAELANDQHFPNEIPLQFHDDIREHVRNRFDYDYSTPLDDMGNFKNKLGPFKRENIQNQQDLKTVSDEFSRLKNWFPDMMEKLLREARIGNIALLRELNLVGKENEDSDVWNVNYEDFLKSVEDPSLMPRHARGGLLRRAKGGGINNLNRRLKTRMDNRFNKKGRLSGAGGMFDDKIPLLGSNGEYMVNADSVSKPGVLPVLRAIDRLGDIPDSVQESGSNDYANADMGSVEAAVDSLAAASKQGVDLSNEILTDIRSLLKVMSEKELRLLGFPNIPDINLEQMRTSGTNTINKVKDWLSRGFKTATGAVGTVGKTSFNIGRGIIGAGRSLFNMGLDYYNSKSKDVMDIYVVGERKPKIRYTDLQEGKFTDVTTGKPVKCLADIKGVVIDKDNNQIISEEDYKKGLINAKGKPILTWISDRITDVYETSNSIVGKTFRFAKDTVIGTYKYVRETLDGPMDIYVGDEKEPRLKYTVFSAGGYRLKETGKVIRYLSDIKGPIIDEKDQTVLFAEDFDKGFFDINRKPIKSLNDKAKGILKTIQDESVKTFNRLFKLPGQIKRVVTSPFKFLGKGYNKLFGNTDNNTNYSQFGPIQPGAEQDGVVTKWWKDYQAKRNLSGPINYSEFGPVIPGQTPSIGNKVSDILNTARDTATNVVSKVGWLSEITDRLDDIYNLLDWRLAGDKGEVPSSTERTNNASGGRSGRLAKAKGYLKSKFTNAKDAVMSRLPKFRGMIAGGMMQASLLKDKLLGSKELFGDILDKITGKVSLSWTKLKSGEYFDKVSGKVLTKWEDIKGDIVDRFGVVVASITDFKDRFMDETGKPLKASFITKFNNFIENGKDLMSRASGGLSLASTLLKYKFGGLKEKSTDLFTGLKDRAVLYWKDLQEGNYFDELTGKAITKWNDIKGAVVDKFGKVVLTLEEYMSGLKDIDGKSITDNVKNFITGKFKSIKQLGLMGKGMVKSLFGKATGSIKDKFQKGKDWFKGLFSGDKEEITEDESTGGNRFNFSFGSGKVVDRLDKIYNLLNDRLPGKKTTFGDNDGDGDRDNSLADQLQRDRASDAAGEEKSRWQKFMDKFKGNGGNVDGSKGGLGDLLTKAGTFIKGAVGALTTFFSGGVIAKIVSFVTSGKGAIARGAAMLAGAGTSIAAMAGTAATAVGAAGTAVAGVVTLPGLLVGAAVIGTAYAGYKLYKMFNKKTNPIAAFRMVQYGFDPSDQSKADMIGALEKECKSILRVSKSGASFDKGKKAADLVKLFNIDVNNQEQLDNWVNWFKYRFTPVYLQHAYTIYLLTGKSDVSLADTGLKSKDQKDYLSKVYAIKSSSNPYEIENSPFGDDDETEYDADDVKDEYEDTLEIIEDNAETTDSRLTDARETKKSFGDKIRDTLKSAKDTVSKTYNKAVDFTSGAIESGANLYNKAVNKTTQLFETGRKAYDKAVDYTAQGIEQGANALGAVGNKIKGAVQWSKNASANLFNRISEAARKYGVSEEYMLAMAYIESKGDPNATSSTGCKGIYQFTKGTGKQYGLFKDGVDIRYDEQANIDAGARLARDNMLELRKLLGRNPEPWMLYLAHQQGIGGLATIMKAAMNGTDVPSNIRRNMNVNGGRGLSPSEFLDKWRLDYQQKAAKITGKTTLAIEKVKPTPTPAPATATGMVDNKTTTPVTNPAKTVTAVTTSPTITPAQAAKDSEMVKKLSDTTTAAKDQVEINRSAAAAASVQNSADALQIQKQLLAVNVEMNKGIGDMRGILSRIEKQVAMKMAANQTNRQEQSTPQATPSANPTRNVEKPPVSMSR